MSRLSIVRVRLDREVNGYLVTCTATGEAVLIDPGQPSAKLVEQIGDHKLRWAVATHGHPGHVGGKDDLKAATGATTALHGADAKEFLRSADHYLVDGDELEFGEFRLRVLHTPGHTPGSVCLLVANHLFCGDTLLAGSIGKRMPETNLQQQLASIGSRLLRLPPATALYPGHGPVTSLERELAVSPVFSGLRA